MKMVFTLMEVMMSELSYKELQEQGIFDVPYRAFEFMQSQQAKIDELQSRVDEALDMLCKLQYSSSERIYNDVGNILKGK